MIHPNSLANLKRGRNDSRVSCPHCEKEVSKPYLPRHISTCVKNPDFGTPCPKCGTIKDPRKQTCSTSCYNSLFRTGIHNPNHKQNGSYRTICFHHHKQQCCVCGWDLIVEVHHYDGDHKNNDPENLIPLCPNHHQLWHSSKRELIAEVVENYRDSFIQTRGIA